MPYEYQFMTQDEQDETLVAFMTAQERDHYSHTINLARFNKILETAKEGPWKDRVAQLKADTEKRLEEVSGIIDATTPTLPPQSRLNAAKTRLKAKGAI